MTLPGPNRVNLPPGTNSAAPNSGQQDPRLHGHSQDPGPSSHLQHPASARPVYYVHAPPPPPFLHYQWPMPLSYNPFSGFPGMGYGMVMPPFPPPPYMEAPAYILPHPHFQAVDYRRLLHPQVHAPCAPYQNPNQPRRIRPPHMVPVRETVSSEVQTEPTHRGVGCSGSDSGHGTSSNSPSSSTSSQKRGTGYVENYTVPSGNAEDFQVNRTSTCIAVKQGINIPHTTGMKTVQSRVGATPETQKSRKDSASQENDPPCRNYHCNMWSVSSPDSIIPVCSSSQQESEVVKERRVSFPDILMSWGGGTPQSTVLKMTDEVHPQDNRQQPSQIELEHEKSLYQSPAETQNDPVVADGPVANDVQDILSSKNNETFAKILKLPLALYDLLSDARGDDKLEELDGSLRHCLPCRDEPPDDQDIGNETNLQADTTEVIPCQMPMNSSQIKRKMNESVWSVESLAPFIPSKEWLLQNAVFEPDVIVEMIEEDENCKYSTQNDLIVKAGKIRQNFRFYSSDSVRVSDSSLIFSTPAEKPPKKPEMQSEMSRGKQDQSMTPSEKHLLASPTCLQSKTIVPSLTAEGVDENRSSEPEAHQSPNQEYLIVNAQRERSLCSHEQGETLLLSSAAREETSSRDLIDQNRVDIVVEDGTYGSEERSRLRNEQMCFPVAEQRAEVSKMQCQQCSSKGHLVDCGVQCTELKELQELCLGDTEPNGGHPLKYSDVKKSKKGKDEGFCMQKNQRRHNQWRNGSSERYSSQQDAVNGYSRPGKSKGGNGRNPRY